MGGVFNRSIRDKLLIDIAKTNQITRNELFERKTGLGILFSYPDDAGFIKKMFLSRLILVEIVHI